MDTLIHSNAKKDISEYLSKGKNTNSYEAMYLAGMRLPTKQRALIAQMYYQRVHLRELGIKLAATCEYHILRSVFGSSATDLIIEQSEHLEGENIYRHLRS